MADEKTPLEQALDLFVYAPIGLALTVQEELPKLIEKGHSRVSGQMMMAKMIGQFAVQQGQREAEKQVKKAAARLEDLGVVRRDDPAPAAAPDPVKAPAPAATAPASSSAASAPSAAPAPATAAAPAPSPKTNGGGVPPVDQLAIPGYDSLSASQVVQRLAGLSAPELDAVARYETATRHRKTILSRVAQLQSAG